MGEHFVQMSFFVDPPILTVYLNFFSTFFNNTIYFKRELLQSKILFHGKIFLSLFFSVFSVCGGIGKLKLNVKHLHRDTTTILQKGIKKAIKVHILLRNNNEK